MVISLFKKTLPLALFGFAFLFPALGIIAWPHLQAETHAQRTENSASIRTRSDQAVRAKAIRAGVTPVTEVFIEMAAAVGQGAPAKRLVGYKTATDPTSQPRYWAIVDFSQRSTNKRLYVFDTEKKKVEKYYVSHGRGSEGSVDDGMAEAFSNRDGSFSSSLGIYRALDEYTGQHGRSMRLAGVESTNSNALSRAVVLHTADYVSDAFIRQTGRLGRSEGCFAVERAVGDRLIDQLKNSAYIIAWKG